MRVVVQIAASGEWRSLHSLLGNPSGLHNTPVGPYAIKEQGPDTIIALHGGVGKVHAAAAAQYAILAWQPDLVAVLGTSGALARDLRVLDLVMANRTIIYDIESPIDGSTNENIRDLTTDLPVPPVAALPHCAIHVGTVLTGDRDVTAATAQDLHVRFGGLAADWESGAVAKVCGMNGVRCLILRGISDSPFADGAGQGDQYMQNTPRVMERLWQVFTSVLSTFPVLW